MFLCSFWVLLVYGDFMIRYYLGISFLLFSFFPFVSPYPFDTDLQPIVPVLALVIFIYALSRGEVKAWVVILFFATITISILTNPFGNFDLQLSKQISLLVAFLCFFSAIYSKKYLTYNVFKVTLTVYLLFTCITYINNDYGFFLQSLVVRNVNSTDLSYRGISTLSTEPGLFSGVIVGIWALLNACKNNTGKIQYISLTSICFFLIFASKSGTGVALLIFYLVFKYIKTAKNFSYLVIFLIILASFIYTMLDDPADVKSGSLGRGVQLLSVLITEPSSLMNDSSLFYRINALWAGILSLFIHPFGVGFGDFDYAVDDIVNNNQYLKSFYQNSKFGFRNVSSIGFYLVSIGWLFLLPFLTLLVKSKAAIENKVIAVAMLSFSYSFAFPLAWLLLAVEKRE